MSSDQNNDPAAAPAAAAPAPKARDVSVMIYTEADVEFMPKYPIVKLEPTVDDCIRSFRYGDYARWVGVTAACWGFGFVRGRPARFVMANLMGCIGFTFGSLMLLQDARARFVGSRPNAPEVKRWGAVPRLKLTEEQIEAIHEDPAKMKDYVSQIEGLK